MLRLAFVLSSLVTITEWYHFANDLCQNSIFKILSRYKVAAAFFLKYCIELWDELKQLARKESEAQVCIIVYMLYTYRVRHPYENNLALWHRREKGQLEAHAQTTQSITQD